MTATTPQKPRILCVDDEVNVLEGLTRHLRRTFEVETAVGGQAGIAALKERGPFAVLMSDLRMPGIDGVALLKQAREISPSCVRMLLTGQGDMRAAAAAINEGNIFRFLIKPCPVDQLSTAMTAAVDQHRLLIAEKELLEQTLRGSVQTLVEVLSMTSPDAFGRASRIKHWADAMCTHFQVASRWDVEVAALLSQLGSVVLPSEVVTLHYKGGALDEGQRKMVARVPAVTEQLLANIPRLEPVRAILHAQGLAYDAAVASGTLDQIPWGARVLRLLTDLDVLEASGMQLELALQTIEGRREKYEPAMVQALRELRGAGRQMAVVRDLPLDRVRPGMVLVEDVRARTGMLLMARGQRVTPELLERLRNFNPSIGIQEPLRCQIFREAAELEVA